MNKAIFSCEASLEIGTGHVMRCLVLAEKLKNEGWQCDFAASDATYNLIPKVRNFIQINPQKFWDSPYKHDLLVVDNYTLDEKYENHFRQYAEKTLIIDDLANRKHNCDILLDQNLGTKIADYAELTNKDCKILAGTEFCLLRSEFTKLREKALNKRLETTKINKILINFGGSDLKNHSIKALELVKNSAFLGEIIVVLGFNAINFDSVENFAREMKNSVKILKEANMAELIFEADLAIAAGGTSAWERCCLGLPTYIIKIADNQEKIFKALGTTDSFDDFYQKISNDYQKYVNNISNFVDGKGVDRIFSFI